MNYTKFTMNEKKKKEMEEYQQLIKDYEVLVNSLDKTYLKDIFREGLHLGVFKKKIGNKIVPCTDNDQLTIRFNVKDGYEYSLQRRKLPQQVTQETLLKNKFLIESQLYRDALNRQPRRQGFLTPHDPRFNPKFTPQKRE